MDQNEDTPRPLRAFESSRSLIRQKRLRKRQRRMAISAGLAALLLVTIGIHYRHSHARRIPRVASAPQAIPELPDPPGILFHHSDTPASVGGVKVDASVIDRIHGEEHKGWAITYQGKTYHIGYHFVILPDGTVQTGRPIHCQGAHCPHYNNWIGICLVGAFSTLDNPHWWPQRPTHDQIESLVKLTESLMSQYHIPPENVRRHRDVHSTYCPGGRFPYDAIMVRIRDYAKGHPETRARKLTKTSAPVKPPGASTLPGGSPRTAPAGPAGLAGPAKA